MKIIFLSGVFYILSMIFTRGVTFQYFPLSMRILGVLSVAGITPNLTLGIEGFTA